MGGGGNSPRHVLASRRQQEGRHEEPRPAVSFAPTSMLLPVALGSSLAPAQIVNRSPLPTLDLAVVEREFDRHQKGILFGL